MITKQLIKITVCPYCHAELKEDNNKLTCFECNKIYLIRNGIPDFRQKDDYWCNISREKMRKLNYTAEQTGDWLNSAKKIIPEYVDHFSHLYRADSQFLWPTNKDSRILDAGCMWGGVTIPAAQFHREIYAVDKTVETLEFLEIRAKQLGFNNIYAVAAPLKTLPFKDNFFDHIILNGVLEWVGLEEDVILEKHWKGGRREKQKYSKTPEQMQADVLKELCRVLKPEGSLYIAIENRYGIQYFLTYPDNHNNVRFVSFMPRFMANAISKIRGKGQYRTYVYSPGQLSDLLSKSGFKVNSMYGLYPHYIKIKKAFPLGMASLFKWEVQIDGVIPKVLHKILNPFIPKVISSYISPSLFSICAKNNNKTLIPRIQNILIKANVINKDDNVKFVISNNRYSNYNSSNIVIYDYKDCPIYFCKIARDVKFSGLRTEAENLRWVCVNMPEFKTEIFQFTELVYYGTIDDIEIIVTNFFDAKNIKLRKHYIINKALDKIGLKNGFLRRAISSIEEKLFLKRIDDKMKQAINVLVKFQKITSNSNSSIKNIVNNVVDKYIEYQQNIPDVIKQSILRLKESLENVSEIDILTCMVHGDYDFNNILFFKDNNIGLVDFEHTLLDPRNI